MNLPEGNEINPIDLFFYFEREKITYRIEPEITYRIESEITYRIESE